MTVFLIFLIRTWNALLRNSAADTHLLSDVRTLGVWMLSWKSELKCVKQHFELFIVDYAAKFCSLVFQVLNR